jgi:hypothetical protein
MTTHVKSQDGAMEPVRPGWYESPVAIGVLFGVVFLLYIFWIHYGAQIVFDGLLGPKESASGKPGPASTQPISTTTFTAAAVPPLTASASRQPKFREHAGALLPQQISVVVHPTKSDAPTPEQERLTNGPWASRRRIRRLQCTRCRACLRRGLLGMGPTAEVAAGSSNGFQGRARKHRIRTDAATVFSHARARTRTV